MVVLTRLGPPEEGIRHKQDRTAVYVNEKCLGRGDLYISEARVSWVGEAGQGFSLEYPHVAMHAVQRSGADAAFPHAVGDCLYLVIDVRLVDSDETPTPSSTPRSSDGEEDREGGAAGAGAGAGAVGANDDDDGGITEIRFVPEDASRMQAMFDAMSACQALHPDPADISEEEEEEEGEEEEGEDGGGGAGDAPEVEGMFDDAEEEDDGQGGGGGGGGETNGDRAKGQEEEEPMEEDGRGTAS